MQSRRPSDVIPKSKERAPLSLVFPENSGAHGMMFLFRDYTYNSPGSFKLLSRNDVVTRGFNTLTLPIPNNLTDNNELRLSRSDMGLTGDIIAQKSRDLGDLAKNDIAFLDFIQKQMSEGPLNGTDAANAVMSGDTKTSMDAVYLLRNATSNNIGRSVNVGVGTTPNPRAALSFEGSEFKTHSFQWVLMPRNERESDILNDMVNMIKRMQLPSYGGDSIDKLYLKYPKTVDIFLLGVDEQYFSKYKTGMIRSFTVNPTANGGLGIMRGGKPSSLSIDMSIMEMDIHTADEY